MCPRIEELNLHRDCERQMEREGAACAAHRCEVPFPFWLAGRIGPDDRALDATVRCPRLDEHPFGSTFAEGVISELLLHCTAKIAGARAVVEDRFYVVRKRDGQRRRRGHLTHT